MTKKTKRKAPKVAAPQTESEAAQLLKRLGDLKRDIAALKAEAEKEIAGVKAKYDDEVAPVVLEAAAAARALHKWADRNRTRLCAEGGKTIALATGEIAWRLGPEAVELDEGFDEEKVIALLRQRGCFDAIRVTEALDKDAIKRLWPHLEEHAMRGLVLVQREFFQLKPSGLPEPIEVKTKTTEVVDRLDGKPRKGKAA